MIYDAWTGAYGAKNKDFTKRRVDAQTIVFETEALRPGEGITVEVTMPADAVARPGWTSSSSGGWSTTSSTPSSRATLVAAWPAGSSAAATSPARGTIVVNYEPPDGL